MLVLMLMFVLCSCRSTSGTEHDQIVRTSIDLAQAYVERGDYSSALDVYDRALLQADDYRLYYNKAIVLSRLGLYAEAAALCADAFLTYPYILSFKTAQVEYLKAMEDGDGISAVYLEILELNPYDRTIRQGYIDHLIAHGNEDEAYNQVLVLWNQGYKDKETATYLHQLNPDTWENVYNQLNK